MKNTFILYTTMWTEGVVAAHTTDKKFAIGYDAMNGGVVYAESLDELENTHSFNLIEETDDMYYAEKHDTALYHRYPSKPWLAFKEIEDAPPMTPEEVANRLKESMQKI